MTRPLSLRARLTAIILLPVMAIAVLAALWQLAGARDSATRLFDNALLSAALAVTKDVAISGGDALSPTTRDILASTSGGTVYYHVYAPDGVIIAGYATPPVGIPNTIGEAARPKFFEAVYLGRDVSGVRLQTQTEIEGFSGLFTTTVWQDTDVRAAFVRDLLMRYIYGSVSLIGALGMVVWFGVRIGLRPLLNLEQAIAQRTSDELSPIKRAVPEEVGGIVSTLNRLFGQVTYAMTAQADFIANAAHQLRNPIAGIQSLTEAVESARTPEAAKTRTKDLLEAVKKTTNLTEQLLLHERAQTISPKQTITSESLLELFETWASEFASLVPQGVNFEHDIAAIDQCISIDKTMLKEALCNLVTNAVIHGGADLSRIVFGARSSDEHLTIWVVDNGRGIPPDRLSDAKTRFVQVGEQDGSGLGLSIADAVATAHGGKLNLSAGNPGLRAVIKIPMKDR